MSSPHLRAAASRLLPGTTSTAWPSITTRGMGPREMMLVAALIGRALDAPQDEKVLSKVRGDVRDLCAHFPMYQDRV